MEIILYIYIALAVLIYVFIQLNYIFSWFKNFTGRDAMGSLMVGIIAALFWPGVLIVAVILTFANYMEKLHDTYKK